MMKIVRKIVFPVVMLASYVLLFACAAQSTPTPAFVTTPQATGNPQFLNPTSPAGGYPAPDTTTGTAYPGPSSGQPAAASTSDGRGQTALAAVKLAQKIAAERFDQKSVLYAIIPSQTMLANLGHPPVLPGWFYKFKVPGTRREFIVQIIDDSATGTTTAEPIEEPKPAERPIDPQQLKLDSPQVFEKFQAFASKQQLKTQGVVYDLDLVNLEGTNGPVWSVVDPATKQRIYSVDAVTGEEIPNFGK